ncbi:MAG: nucleotidyltransferase substrate binding protein [Firmicutes bacterium]|nr:nucleotidyltransferase substrate binding protein [Bacillota bacterium]
MKYGFSKTESDVMNINDLENKLTTLKKTVVKLHESTERDYLKDDIVLDATIQRFEFTFEMSWKLMKAYLEYEGIAEATSPRSSIREAFKQGLIEDGDVWLDMLLDRNRTVHTYDEETAIVIYNNVKSKYLSLFDSFCDVISKRL